MHTVPRFITGAVLAVALLGPSRSHAADATVARAVRARDGKALAALIAKGEDVNAPQADGATGLHWAAHWDDGAMADDLLRAGARVAAANDYGVKPLHLAAINGSVSMVARLLKAGADGNTALPSGETVLMTAARTGRVDVVRLLLASGAVVDQAEDTHGQTALMWAAAEGHVDTVRTLLDAGASIAARSKQGYTPLLFAARTGRLELAKLLLDRGAAIDDAAADGVTPLLMAAVRNKLPLAYFLLERGARADGNSAAGFTPLHWASGVWESLTSFDYQDEDLALEGLPRAQKPAFIDALLRHGADVNARAAKAPPRFGGRISRVFAPVSEVGASPLWFAAAAGDIETVTLLLGKGADASLAAGDGTTPLMAASGILHSGPESHIDESRFLAVARLLLDRGADPRASNAAGSTALHATAWAGFPTITRLLIERGAPLGAKTKQGYTALRVADGVVFAMQLHYQEAVGKVLREFGATE